MYAGTCINSSSHRACHLNELKTKTCFTYHNPRVPQNAFRLSPDSRQKSFDRIIIRRRLRGQIRTSPKKHECKQHACFFLFCFIYFFHSNAAGGERPAWISQLRTNNIVSTVRWLFQFFFALKTKKFQGGGPHYRHHSFAVRDFWIIQQTNRRQIKEIPQFKTGTIHPE